MFLLPYKDRNAIDVGFCYTFDICLMNGASEVEVNVFQIEKSSPQADLQTLQGG